MPGASLSFDSSDRPIVGRHRRDIAVMGLLTNDKVVFALVAGLPATVLVLAVIWARPRSRAPLWGLASVVMIGLVGVGAWAAFHARPTEASAGAAASPAANCAPAGPALRITARGIAFSTSCLAAPANTAFTIAFTNQDASIGHSVHIL